VIVFSACPFILKSKENECGSVFKRGEARWGWIKREPEPSQGQGERGRTGLTTNRGQAYIGEAKWDPQWVCVKQFEALF